MPDIVINPSVGKVDFFLVKGDQAAANTMKLTGTNTILFTGPISASSISSGGGSGFVTTSTPTIGYIPKYTSSTNIANSLIYDNATNIGIGTNSPLSKLHVISATSGATLLRADGTNGTLFSVVDDLTDSLMSVNNSAGLPVLEVFADDRIVGGQYGKNDFVVVNNKVGIGTNNPTAKLQVTSSVSSPSAAFLGGNVGIGTTSPAYKLDVSGILASGGSPIAWFSGNYNRIYEPAGNPALYLGNNSDPANYYDNNTHFFRNRGGSSNYAVIEGNGNLGIGTTSVTEAIHVYRAANSIIRLQAGGGNVSGVRMDDASSSGYLLKNRTSDTTNNALAGALYTYTDSNKAFQHIHNGTPLFTILSGGNVGIGITAPTAKLHVTGSSSIPAALLMGNVGIGTTSFTYGTTNRGLLEVYGASDSLVALRNSTGNLYIQKPGSDVYINNTNAGIMSFATSNTQRMVIFSGGSISIGSTSDTLGSPGNIYLNGNTGNAAGPVLAFGQSNSVTGGIGHLARITGGGTSQDIFIQSQGASNSIGLNANPSGAAIYFQTQGAEKARITAAGNLGIGTSTPATKVDIYGPVSVRGTTVITTNFDLNAGNAADIYGNIRVLRGASLSDGMYIGYGGAGGNLKFFSNSGTTEFMTIATTGNVGIGSTSPAAKLDIVGTNTTIALSFGITVPNNPLFINTYGGYAGIGMDQTTAGIRLVGDYSGGTNPLVDIGYYSSGTVAHANWVNRLRVLNNGNIGIGTTSPITKLQVRDGAITAGTTTSTSGTTMLVGQYTDGYLTVLGTEQSSGGPMLGYGVTPSTTSAGAFLSSTGINVYRSAYVQDGATHRWYTGGVQTVVFGSAVSVSEKMRINLDGNLGIGTTSPAYKLEVIGDARISGGIINPSLSAQWTLSGGGTVTYNGSAILWSNRVIAIPVEKDELSTTGYIDINCPTSGTITYYNSGNGISTVTCAASGIPIGIWEALYYEITPGQTQAFDQTRFRLVNYQNSTWRPSSNWLLICTVNGDASSLKWTPGQVIIPTNGSFDSSNSTNNWQIAGTTNYVPKFTSANKIGNSVLYDNGANIGIGTTTIPSPLTVYNNSDVWHFRFGGASGELRMGGQTNSGAVIQAYTPAGAVRDLYLQRDGGNVGIGTNSPAFKLDVKGNVFVANAATGNNIISFGNIGGLGPLSGAPDGLNGSAFLVVSSSVASGAPSHMKFYTTTAGGCGERLRITSDGNVGVGVTNPSYKLQIAGNLAFDGGLSTRMLVSYTNLTNVEDWQNSPISIRERDLVGATQSAGKYSPNINFHWASRYSKSIWMDSNGILNWGEYDGSGVPAADGTFKAAVLLATANVGIGTNSPGYKFEIGAGTSNVVVAKLTQGTERVRFQGFDLLGYNDGTLWMIGNNATNGLVLGSNWDWDAQAGIYYTPGTYGAAGGSLEIGQLTKNNANYTHGNTRFYTNGVERMRIISTGNVGIGTTTPDAPLHIYRASNSWIHLNGGGSFSYIRFNDGTSNAYLFKNTTSDTTNGALAGAMYTYTDSNKAFQHIHSGTPLFTILSGGNVGIGTTAPTAKLDVRGVIQGQSYPVADTGGTGGWVKLGTLTIPQNGYTCHIRAYIHAGFNALNSQDYYVDIFFKTSNASSVDANGFAGNSWYYTTGYTTSDPAPKWVGNAAGVSATAYDLYLSLSAFTNRSHYIVEIVEGATWVNVGSTGQVNPGNGSSTVCVSSVGFNLPLGSLGVGTTSPAYRLDVNGTGRFTGDLTTNGNIVIARAGAYLYINGTNSDAEIVWQTNGSNRWAAGMNVGDATENFNIYNYTTATTNFTILKANGNVGIGSTSPIAKLDINGTSNFGANVYHSVGGQKFFAGNGSTYAYIYTGGTALTFINSNDSGTLMTLLNGGNLGIGTTTPSKKLQVIGSIGKGVNLYEVPIDSLGAIGTQAKRYEIARVFIDYNDWNNTGPVELEVRESYYSDGRYKRYVFSYGYNSSNAGSLWLVEDSGRGANDFKAEVGAAVQISGDIYYVPIYIDLDYYQYVDALVRTNRTRTTNASSPSGGVIYINESPTGTNISSFSPDEVTYISLASSKTYLGYSGNVGVGTSNPTGKLHIAQANSGGIPAIRLSEDESTIQGPSANTQIRMGGNLVLNASSVMLFGTNGSERIRIDSNGNVGIGTTSPAYKLDVNGTFRTATNNLTLFNDYIYVSPTNNNTLNSAYNVNGIADMWINFRGYNDGQTQFRNFNVGDGKGTNIAWFDGTNKRMSINNGQSAGYTLDVNGTLNVSGTSTLATISATGTINNSATNALNIINNNGYISIYNNAGSIRTGYLQGNTASSVILSAENGAILRFDVSSSERVRIDTNGNVGIGTTSPSGKLHVIGETITFKNGSDSQTTHFYIANAANTRAYNIQLNSAGTNLALWGYNSSNTWQNLVNFNYNGNVGIGTTSPLAQLHAVSTTAGATLLRADGTNGTLFSVIDDLSDSLMSVNNSAGLPVFEVFADDRIVGGQYGKNDFVVRNNKVGIGTNNPVSKLAVSGSVSIGSTSYNVAAPANGLIVQGSVGIGTTTPYANLHIRTTSYSADLRVEASDEPRLQLRTNDSLANVELFNSYGNVGLISYGSGLGGGNYVIYYNAGSGTASNGYIDFQTNGADRMRIKGDGNVGINTSSPTQKLHVDGSIYTSAKLVQKSTTQSLSGTTGCTIDLANGVVHILSLANATVISSFTYSNRDNNPSVNTLMLVFKYAGTASATFTNVIWANGVAPTLTGTNGYADVFMLTSYQGGAGTPVWIGTVVAQALVSTNL